MRIFRTVCAVAIATCFGVFTGCEWGASDDFNTSQGAGTVVNFSGYYTPRSGAVLAGSNITALVFSQMGNSLEVRDSNNSSYSGYVGSPGTLASRDSSGAYPAGATVLQAQINFSGRNELTGMDVSFAGMIHAVAVTDVRGVTTTSGSSYDRTTTTDIVDPLPPATPVITINNTTNNTGSTTATTTYQITEANTQYVLQGNWMEGSTVYSVNAIAPAISGSFSTSSSTNGP